MAAKQRKRTNNSTKRTQPRSRRLLKARSWIGNYNGKHIVRGYARHFRVDLLCAITELRLLGITVSEAYEHAVRQTLAAQSLQKKSSEDRKQSDIEKWGQSDDHFGFIIGYTPGGAPFGIRWEDMPDMDSLE